MSKRGNSTLVLGLALSLDLASPSARASDFGFLPHDVSLDSPNVIAVGDVDGDDDLDIVTRSATSLRWYQNIDGQGSFATAQTLAATTFSAELQVVDLDGDSLVDLLTVETDGIGWRKNLGGAVFGARQVITTGATPVPADLDGDDDLDLLYGPGATWRQNLGGGSFGPAVDIFSSASGIPLAFDLDEDDDLDVMRLTGTSPNGVLWHANLDGAGTFSSSSTKIANLPMSLGPIITTIPYILPAMGDLDGDGDGDLAFWNFQQHWTGVPTNPPVHHVHQLCWNENVPAGLWPFHSVHVNDTPAGEPFGWDDLDLVDADADGTIEMLDAFGGVGMTNYLRLELLPGAYTLAAGHTRYDWRAAIGDVDGDGDPDVVASYKDFFGMPGGMLWYENVTPDCNGNGVTDDDDILSGTSLDCDGDQIPDDCEDCNGNGIGDDCEVLIDCNSNSEQDACDIDSGASADCNANTVPDSCDIGSGASPDCNANAIPDSCDLASGTSPDCNGNAVLDTCDIAAGSPDCNANGKPDSCDLASGTSPDCNGNAVLDTCDIAAGSPDCNANGKPDSCDLASGTSPDCNANDVPDSCDLAAGSPDCDGNALPDACETDCNGNGLADVCDTPMTHAAHELPTASPTLHPLAVHVADLDGDFRPDLLAAMDAEDTVSWYRNLGSGLFGSRITIAANLDGARSVIAADLDGDDDLDVVAASGDDDRITWFPNLDGAGSFGPPLLVTTSANGVRTVAAADIDRDGDLDLLRASEIDDVVAWHENANGLGTSWVLHTVTNLANGALQAVPADINRDGKLDIVAASAFDGTIAWWRQTGTGAFPSKAVLIDTLSVSAVAVADMDGDRDLDVLAAIDESKPSLILFENYLGNGSQWILHTLYEFETLHWLVPRDLDGDSDLDVLAAGSSVFWLEHQGTSWTWHGLAVGNLARGADAADLDGDGDVDLLVALTGLDLVRWYENLSDDCNANEIPDSCETDCNANGIADSCDLTSQVSLDCNGNSTPDECDTGCTGPTCDADGDGCEDAVDTAPLDPDACGDSDSDTCDDCSSGAFAPEADLPDADHDGTCDAVDCSPSQAAWAAPGPVSDLLISRETSFITLQWQPPTEPGGTGLTYDTLRSTLSSDFVLAATCILTGDPGTTSTDTASPPPGGLLSYLVRADNACAAPGSLGTDSNGVEREGKSCP